MDILVLVIGFFMIELSFLLMIFGYMLMFKIPQSVWVRARKNIDVLDPYIIEWAQPLHEKIQWIFIPTYSIVCAAKIMKTLSEI